MNLIYCSNKKCKMKKHCIRFTANNKRKELTENLKQICNYENEYRWIYLDTNCENIKYQKIYKERKQQC